MKQWTEERCAERPLELQEISPDTFMERRNIREVEHEETEDMPAYTEWVCESREISKSDYHMLQSITEINTQAAIDNYTEQLIEEGLL